MTSFFGDIEPDDVWDATKAVAPEQVGRRLHELSVDLSLLAGITADRWHELSETDRLIATRVGEKLAVWLTSPHPDIQLIAEQTHDYARSLVRAGGKTWDELSPEERSLAARMILLILQWLRREGPR